MECPAKVTIVVPIYNVEKYIGQCLESLFSQTYLNIEYVFVNDSTPDNSMGVLNAFVEKYNVSDKCVVINNSANVGLAATRIVGIKAAHGDYLMFVDSDDYLSRNAVESLLLCAQNNDADIVESNMQYNSDSGDKVLRRCKKEDVREYIYSFISFEAPPSLMGKLYKKDLFFDVDKLFIIGRDYIEDTYASPLLYSRAKKIENIDEITYYYRTNNASSHSKGAKWKKIEDLVFVIGRFEQLFCADSYSIYNDAIKEAKFRIKSTYYSIYGKEDRKRLMKLFPENDDYVSQKSLLERMCWFLMVNDYYFMYNVVIKLYRLVRR